MRLNLTSYNTLSDTEYYARHAYKLGLITNFFSFNFFLFWWPFHLIQEFRISMFLHINLFLLTNTLNWKHKAYIITKELSFIY